MKEQDEQSSGPLQCLVGRLADTQWEREGSTVFALNGRGHNRWFATVQPVVDDAGERVSAAECEAIATLVRAAPELLEVLQRLIEKDTYADIGKFTVAIIAAHNVIAKAVVVSPNSD